MSNPYRSGELIDIAVGNKRVDPHRIIDTYGDKRNWKVINAPDENGDMRAYWTWHGPVIVGYELAQWAPTVPPAVCPECNGTGEIVLGGDLDEYGAGSERMACVRCSEQPAPSGADAEGARDE